jgi:hypothetical protein
MGTAGAAGGAEIVEGGGGVTGAAALGTGRGGKLIIAVSRGVPPRG